LVNRFISEDPLRKLRDFLIVLICSTFDENKPVLVLINKTKKPATEGEQERYSTCGRKVFIFSYDHGSHLYELTFYYKQFRTKYRVVNPDNILTLFKLVGIGRIIHDGSILTNSPAEMLRLIRTGEI